MLLCKFCNRECKNENSLRNHMRLCKSNPDRQYSSFLDPKVRASFTPSNAAIKAKNEGREYITSQETRYKLSENSKSRTSEWNKENGRKIADAIKRKVDEGTWHTSLAKHMHIDYNGIDLHGSWELAYAKFLDANNIKWQRCNESFAYEFDGKIRKYTPDFYLIDSDEYVEIKGYKTKKDYAKWDQFPKHRKLIVLMSKELKEMKIIPS